MTETFEFLTDPLFAEKVCDIVDLYLSPLSRCRLVRPSGASTTTSLMAMTSLFAASDAITGRAIG